MRTFPEYELDVPPLWFTGKEWKDGTAEMLLQEQYDQAIRKRVMQGPTCRQ